MTALDRTTKPIKRLTVGAQLECLMFIKPQKVAEFIALWNTMRELSGVQRQNLPNNCRINMPDECTGGLFGFRGQSSSKNSAFLFAGCERLVGGIAAARALETTFRPWMSDNNHCR